MHDINGKARRNGKDVVGMKSTENQWLTYSSFLSVFFIIILVKGIDHSRKLLLVSLRRQTCYGVKINIWMITIFNHVFTPKVPTVSVKSVDVLSSCHTIQFDSVTLFPLPAKIPCFKYFLFLFFFLADTD